jgi:hypothetical protein
MRRVAVTALLLLCAVSSARAQPHPSGGRPSGDPSIVWEVKNRFRLFRHEQDFLRHVAAHRGDGILAAEQRLARATDGRGWARTMVNALCVDGAGRLLTECERDGERENYLAPVDHRIGAIVANAPADATCAWTFDDGEGLPRAITVPCGEEVRVRVRYGRPTIAAVDVMRSAEPPQRVIAEILVRDVLIAGLGDSIASGDGNPDRPVLLSDDGFCFRRFLGGASSAYYRPGRAGYRGNRSCDGAPGGGGNGDWAAAGARWMSAPCHRSLYSYQVRTALALAIEQPHLAVTFLPLACTGASIEEGLIKGQSARECPPRGPCPGTVPGQLAQLHDALAAARRQNPNRTLDAVLLTVGANDVQFSELVADVMIESGTERTLFARAGRIGSVEQAERLLAARLPGDFARLRAALRPMVGGDLKRVIYVSYGNPALRDEGVPCDGGRAGFDVHPAFAIDPGRIRRAAAFVDQALLPRLRALALCEGGVICSDPVNERMTFVDAHQQAFAQHGFCVRADSDPAFDNECFSAEGESFRTSLVEGAVQPLACGRSAREFRPYAPRARWIRTANDSYFTAMTYPRGISALLQPADIHDATWGALSAVYGGAIHPTAEGHAAMADAALPELRSVLGLATERVERSELSPLRPN